MPKKSVIQVHKYTFHANCTELTGATLFRGLSPTTKMLAVYYRKEGHKYLKKIVDPLLAAVNSRSDSWEIDPNKLDNHEMVEKNLEKLMQVTQELIDNLVNTANDCPR